MPCGVKQTEGRNEESNRESTVFGTEPATHVIP